MNSLINLRVRRFRNRITKKAVAQRLGCAESWVNALELGHYHGPAREKWAPRYRDALEELIQEKREKDGH